MEFKNFGDVINFTSGIFVTFKDFFGLFAPSLDTVIKLEKFCILVFIKSLLQKNYRRSTTVQLSE